MFGEAGIILIVDAVDLALRNEHIFGSILDARLRALAISHFRAGVLRTGFMMRTTHTVANFSCPRSSERGSGTEHRACDKNPKELCHFFGISSAYSVRSG